LLARTGKAQVALTTNEPSVLEDGIDRD